MVTQRCRDPDEAAQETRRPGLDHPGRNKQQEPHPPQDWIIQRQVAADSPDWIIRGRTRIRRSQSKKEHPKPHDSSRPSKEGMRPGQEQAGHIKQQEPPPPGLDHPGTSGGGRPGQKHQGRIKQHEPPPPGMEHPGTSG